MPPHSSNGKPVSPPPKTILMFPVSQFGSTPLIRSSGGLLQLPLSGRCEQGAKKNVCGLNCAVGASVENTIARTGNEFVLSVIGSYLGSAYSA